MSKNKKTIFCEKSYNFYFNLPIIFFALIVGFPKFYQYELDLWIKKKSLLQYFKSIFKLLINFFNPFIIDLKKLKIKDKKIEVIYDKFITNINTKKKLFEFRIEEVQLGDLIYDTFLKETKSSTINFDDEYLFKIAKKAIYDFFRWKNIAKEKGSYAVIVTHTCYLQAIPARVFLRYNKKAFQVNHAGIYNLSLKRLWAYNEYYDFPNLFNKLPINFTNKLNKISIKRLKRRFSGEVGVDMAYSKASAYSRNKNKVKILAKSNNIKVLIAPHCLFDAPNGFGRNLFLDFEEWLKFLKKIANVTNYDWYIKTHPDFLPGNEDGIKNILFGSKIKFLPSSTSHLNLIKEGIDVVLTVYGTVASEYAALGKTAINASLSNPHIKYNFNLNPTNKKEYEKILKNLKFYLIKPNKNDVIKYYSMKLYTDTSKWFYITQDEIFNFSDGYVPFSKVEQFKTLINILKNFALYLNHLRKMKKEIQFFLKKDSYKFYPSFKSNILFYDD